MEAQRIAGAGPVSAAAHTYLCACVGSPGGRTGARLTFGALIIEPSVERDGTDRWFGCAAPLRIGRTAARWPSFDTPRRIACILDVAEQMQ